MKVWDPAHELTFGVRSEPASIQSFVHVVRGQFLIIANPDGTTTLQGTTWYDLRLAPSAYWQLWTQPLLHAIHMRVLEHVKRLAEEPNRPLGAPTAMPAWMQTTNATCPCTMHAR